MLLNVHNSALSGTDWKTRSAKQQYNCFLHSWNQSLKLIKTGYKSTTFPAKHGLSTNLPLRDFRVSREARTLGLAAVSHKGPERHLGAGIADLPALEFVDERDKKRARSLRDGPPKRPTPWDAPTGHQPFLYCDPAPRSSVPSLLRKHSCHLPEGIELHVTELVEILRADPKI